MNKLLQKYSQILTLVFHVDTKKTYMCDEKFTSHTIKGHPQSTYAGRGTGGEGMTKACICVQGEGVQPGECVRTSTVYFPFLKIFSIKKKNEYD